MEYECLEQRRGNKKREKYDEKGKVNGVMLIPFVIVLIVALPLSIVAALASGLSAFVKWVRENLQ